MSVYERARNFIYRNARPIDLARWQYHFENGGSEPVLKALSYYQNADGGFGHALEPDLWNPNSSPIQTWCATEILYEINQKDANHTIIQGVLRYLSSKKDFNNGFWSNTIKSNNDYPHAPWWSSTEESAKSKSYNPTACLVGFAAKYSAQDSELYSSATNVANMAFEQLVSGNDENDMHTILCYIRLLNYLDEMAESIIDTKKLRAILQSKVTQQITNDTESWNNSYICKPSQFFNSMSSVFYTGNEAIAQYECDFIKTTQLQDGSWNIPWSWNDYASEWQIAKNWWKSNGIIVNMLFLKGMGKI